jgi:hypothetical protein
MCSTTSVSGLARWKLVPVRKRQSKRNHALRSFHLAARHCVQSMDTGLLLLSLLATAGQLATAGEVPESVGAILGTAVNGSAGDAALAGAEVVLRTSQDGSFVPVAVATTDSDGQFAFRDLPIEPGLIYLPGVNHLGIHYPGPRVRLTQGDAPARVRLIAFETSASPSPLVCRRHALEVMPGEGFLEVTETLLIDNSSRSTFIGQAVGDRPPVTLRLSLPEGIERVTFDREFHGRNFHLHEGGLISELPWPPGHRELKFMYRVPAEKQHCVLNRVLDLTTDQVAVQVSASRPDQVACNLPRARSAAGNLVVFEQRGTILAAGYEIAVELGDVPMRFETYARSLAVAVLVALVGGSLWLARWRRLDRPAAPADDSPTRRRHCVAARRRMRRPQQTSSSNPDRPSAGV